MRVSLAGAGFLASVLAYAAPSAAQQNPFALAGGPVKSAHVVYQLSHQGELTPGKFEMLLARDQWVLRINPVVTLQGRTDTALTYIKMTPDSSYLWSGFGKARSPGEVKVSIRRHLVGAYAELDAGGQRRLVENLRTIAQQGADFELVTPAIGKPEGTATYAGQKCQWFRLGDQRACLVPGTNQVMLAWEEDGSLYSAISVKLNGSVPASLLAPPKGVRFRPSDEIGVGEGITRAAEVGEVEASTPQEGARGVVRFLASPEAAARLREQPGADE